LKSVPEERQVSGRRPTTPAEVLRYDILESCGITQKGLARAMGVSLLTINQLVNERRSVTAETALRLAAVTGTSASVWLNLQREVDLHDARRKHGAKIAKLRRLPRFQADEPQEGEL
jgi:addiction module HigA family antidote